jgi:tRNA threonylcarbamoyladenosine biosynthesis protein TsaE
MKTIFKSACPADTLRIAATLALSAKPGDIIALTGGLGAGKTVFSKGFAQGLGYVHDVTSPTFTLMNIYGDGRLTLYHFDLYRLDNCIQALEGIGYEDYFFADGVCLVEWADRAADLMPEHTQWISIATHESHREINIK